jgi:hypothetical protein
VQALGSWTQAEAVELGGGGYASLAEQAAQLCFGISALSHEINLQRIT